MNRLSEQEFLAWARGRGVDAAANPRRSGALAFLDLSGEVYSWAVPGECYRRPYFFGALLRLLGDWSTCCAYRPAGSWPAASDLDEIDDSGRMEYQILKGIGVPLGTADILDFSREEFDLLHSLMFAASQFGWSVGEDLLLLPDHARQILEVSHHDKVYVQFRDTTDISQWQELLERQDFGQPERID